MHTPLRYLSLGLLLLGVTLNGCTSEAKTTPNTSNTKTAPDPKAVEARLAVADAKDGKTDKVVTKCAGCNLSMDGKAEHKLDVHGYALHFCAASCKDKFAKDSDASVMAMKIE
jgi:hypothetical protein